MRRSAHKKAMEKFRKIIKKINGIDNQQCAMCEQWKPLTEFPKNKRAYHGRWSYCYICKSERNKDYHQKNPLQFMLVAAKARAKRKKIQFSLTQDDLSLPDICPILGIPLKISRAKRNKSKKGLSRENSPSLDRINNSKGYVKGNVIVVSYKANTIKNNATLKELKKIVSFYERLQAISTSN